MPHQSVDSLQGMQISPALVDGGQGAALARRGGPSLRWWGLLAGGIGSAVWCIRVWTPRNGAAYFPPCARSGGTLGSVWRGPGRKEADLVPRRAAILRAGAKMKPTGKQTANTRKKDVQGPGDDVPVAAQVFGNYLLAPFRRKQNEEDTDSAIHGAAMLVFADQGQEKVALRTGFPANIAGECQSPTADEKEPGRGAGNIG